MYGLVAMATTRRMSHHSTIDFSTFSLSHTANAIIQRFIFNQYSNNREKKKKLYIHKEIWEKAQIHCVESIIFWFEFCEFIEFSGKSSIHLVSMRTWNITVLVFHENFPKFLVILFFNFYFREDVVKFHWNTIRGKKSSLTIQIIILLTLISNVECYTYNAIEC